MILNMVKCDRCGAVVEPADVVKICVTTKRGMDAAGQGGQALEGVQAEWCFRCAATILRYVLAEGLPTNREDVVMNHGGRSV